MKHRTKIVLAFFTGFTLFALLLLPSSSPHTPPTPPEQPKPTALNQPDTSNEPQNKPPTPTAKSNGQEPELSSPTLEANPNAPEVPYYLLASVNDPLHSSAWAHTNIQAGRAWDLSTGSSDVTVAVIDTGYALNHEDLSGSWHENSGETGTTTSSDACWSGSPQDKSSNNCDDDDNNYVDDWRGYDFYNIDNSPQAGEINPSGEGTRHGTLVSGVIAASANNGIGSAGIDHNAKVMPLQVFSDDAQAYTSDLVAAIDYAADNGADVINLSLGTNQYDATLLNSIRRARNLGVLVVAASGNCALNDEVICNTLSAPGRMTYPALYTEVLSVGATNSSDTRVNYSSYGPQLDLVAPGSSVGPFPVYSSSGATNSYATTGGTSFASPLVAGVAALLIAQNPSASISDLEFLLTESTDKVAGMGSQTFTTEYGVGRLNAHKATLLGLARTQTNLLGPLSISPNQQANGYVWRAKTGSIASDEVVLVGCRVASGDICSSTVQNGSIYRFWTANNIKGDEYQYIFISGSAVPSGAWSISVHNRESARQIITLTK